MVEAAAAPSLIDWLDFGLKVATLVVAAGVAIFGVVRFRAEFAASVEQRNRDLQWKQAEIARRLNDEMQADRASDALRLLDYPSAPFPLEGGATTTVSRQQLLLALDPGQPARDPTIRAVREAFDTLFYYLADMQHGVQTGLVRRDDVASPSTTTTGTSLQRPKAFTRVESKALAPQV